MPKRLTCCLRLAADGAGGIVVADRNLRHAWRLSANGRRIRLPGLPTGPDPDDPRYFLLDELAATPAIRTIWGIGELILDEGRRSHAAIVRAELSPI
jgi:hypothetical protein